MPRVVVTDLMPEFAGRTIANGRYCLQVKLGSGAYGKVYRAIDMLPVPRIYRAIKILHRHPSGSDKEKIQQREFSVHQRVSGHNNIVTFHGFFDDPLYVYAVMDFCQEGDLFAAITERLYYQDQPHRIKDTYLQILDAVQHCHEKGIFHRDIKPENILCSGSDGSHIRLADFGLSTANPYSREFGCGSSYYMSPECIGGGKEGRVLQYSTRHNDIWALGVILTNMATGRNPWRYATIDDDCFCAFRKDPEFLKGVLPISIEVNDILKRIFVMDWQSRIPIPELRRRMVKLENIYENQDNISHPQPRRFPIRADSCDPEKQNSPAREIGVKIEKVALDSPVDAPDATLSLMSPSRTAYFSGELLPQRSSLAPPSDSNVSDPSLAPPSGSFGSSGSEPDRSKGPKTPASSLKPVTEIEIPDEVQEYMLDNPANTVVHEVEQVSPADKTRRGMKTGQLLRSAFQRFKG